MKSPPSLRTWNWSAHNIPTGIEVRLLKNCCSNVFICIKFMDSADRHQFVVSKSSTALTSWICAHLRFPSVMTSKLSKRVKIVSGLYLERKMMAIEALWIGTASTSMVVGVGHFPRWRCVTLLFESGSLSLGWGRQTMIRTCSVRRARWIFCSGERRTILSSEQPLRALRLGEVFPGH